MDIDRIPPRSEAGNVHAFVEIPKGSQNKYEYSKEYGVMVLDRTLFSAVHYPTDYGFVPGARSSDGEYLDIMILTDHPAMSGCLVEVRLVGVLSIRGTSGSPEQKLLSVSASEPRYAPYHDLPDMPREMLQEIEQFYNVYKNLEGRPVSSVGWEGAGRANEVLTEAIEAAKREPVTEA